MMYDINRSTVNEIKAKYAAECAEVARLNADDDADMMDLAKYEMTLAVKYGAETAKIIMVVGNM